MRLRTRLALQIGAVTLPCLLVLFAWDGRARHGAAEELLGRLTEDLVADPAELAACAADPAAWQQAHAGTRGPREGRGPPPGGPGGHRPGGKPPVAWVYDERGEAVDPAAPPLPAVPPPGPPQPWPAWWFEAEVRQAVRTAWPAGPCAVIVLEGSTVPGWIGAVLPAPHVLLAPLLLVLGVSLFAVGPLLARVRRLEAAVRRSTEHGYADDVPVEGDDELADLARAFDDAGRAVRARMEERDARERALREHLANTSHDVMLPLTVLQGHLAALRERPSEATLLAAMDEAHYLGALVHNLGAAARLEAHTDLRRPVDLGALVARVVARHRPIARQHGVSVEHALPEEAVTLPGDVTLLEQAVSNLVYNAVRYNRAGGHVAVTLDLTAGGFELRVIDDGPGLSDDDLARMHERGYRADEARTRAPEGQGLGLDIVARVCDRHGLGLRYRRSEFGGLEVEIVGAVGAGAG